jgi:hypothetical protein
VATPLQGYLPTRPVGRVDGRHDPAWWFVGCHGGAGSSTLNLALPGGADGGRYWPVPDAGTAKVILVARTHATGLRAAQTAARQWASGELPATVQLLGLAVICDAPGRRPRPLRELLALMSGGLPHVWDLPWVEALRLGDPADQILLPTPFSAMAADLHQLAYGEPHV